MALSIYEQAIEYIKESKKIVIALDSKILVDNLSAAFVLSRILDHLNKPYQITIEKNPNNFSFLTKQMDIQSSFKQARSLVISLDIADQGLDNFYYNLNDNNSKLEVYVVPKNGFFNPDDVKVGQGGFEYDLIITLGASDLFSLGNVYQDNTAFFHETPIINIDDKAANEKFGEINLIEPTKSSVCEILFDFLENSYQSLIDKKIATALLAGILEKTQSFKVPTLAPQTLEKASRLMAYEADRELVVKELFYNKSLAQVKLWGRVLARLKEDRSKKLYWSLINSGDYERAKADPEIITKVFEEVLNYLPQDGIILLFSEFREAVIVLAYCGDPEVNLKEKFDQYKVEQEEDWLVVKFWNRDLLAVEQEIINLF